MQMLTKYNHNIPDWLFPYMKKECPACGAPLVDDGPGIQLTQRWCPNAYCPRHMALKIVNIANYLGVPGYGPATAEDMVRLNNLKSHLQSVPLLMQGERPHVYVWEVGIMAQIYGISNTWKELLLGYKSFEDYFARAQFIQPWMAQNKDYLLYAESFFDLKEPLSKKVIRIMISGSINGFSNKHDFVPWLNDRVGQHVQIMEVGKRKTGVDFLVKEPSSVDHAKTGVALEAGIPIVSSQEFLQVIVEMLKAQNNKE